jgi:CIC family chloride channel protein
MSARSGHLLVLRVRLRRAWRAVAHRALARQVSSEWIIVVLAALIGVGAGFVVLGFYRFVDGMRAIAGWVGQATGSPGPLIAFATVPLGLLVARWLSSRARVEQGGEMVPILIRRAAKKGGELPLRDMVFKVLSAGVTLGSGGSLGAEGPVAVAGASVGSGFGQAFHFSPKRIRVLLACGTAAGISAAFNAPIAGVLFALEVVAGTFAVGALSPVVVASVMGAVVSRAFLGDQPAFRIPDEFLFVSALELPFYLILGLAAGGLAALFVRAFYGTQDVLRRILGSGPIAALGAGLAVAAMGLVHPELLGDGRQGISLVLASELAGAGALGLGLMKILTAGLTMGGGGAGGVFTPSLFVGASFGSFFGLTAAALFPGMGITPEAYALVGMAAVVAGATFAPLTAIIMVFEMTDDYGLILPLMLVCVVSYLVSRRLGGESLFSENLRRMGERISHGADRSVLERVTVSECYDRNPHVVVEDAPLRAILVQLRGSRQTEFPVVTRELELAGMLSYQQISRALDDGELLDFLIAADLLDPVMEVVTPDDSLLDAVARMGLRDVDFVPVVDPDDPRRLLGLLGRGDIMEAYRTNLLLHD